MQYDANFVVDGKYITSVGGALSYEPALYLVEHLYGAEHARLRIERPRGGSESLERDGANLWVPTTRPERLEEGDIRVRQGHLEESNVDPVGALVEMIEIQRAFTAVQRSMITKDGIMQTLTNDIGRVG